MKKLMIAALLSTAFIGAPALADHHEAPTGDKMMHHSPFEKLNLTDAQKEKIKAIKETQRDELKMAWMEAKRAENAVVWADSFDEAKAKALIASYSSMAEKENLIRLKAKNAMYNVLTDEQKAQLKGMKEDIKERIKARNED